MTTMTDSPVYCQQGHELTGENLGRTRTGSWYCKLCRKATAKVWQATHTEEKRWYWKLTRYGISKDVFEQKIASQNYCCAVCEKPFGDTKGLEPVIDHSHVTNENRGILHRKCNMALGLFQDDPVICKLAGEYLEKYHG